MRARVRTVVLVAVVAVPVMVAAACGDGAEEPTTTSAATGGGAQDGAASLTANPWELVSFTFGRGEGPPTVKGRDAVLRFATDGTLSGTTGCNSFGGTYEVDGPDLTIALGPITRRACTDPALTAQEQTLVTDLGKVTGYAVTDGTLELRVGDRTRFTYTAEDTSLVGTWQVTGVNNGTGGLESSAATAALRMDFTDGAVTVTGGCNTLSADYSTTGEQSLTFGPVASTKKACEGEAAAVDRQMADALGRTTDVEVVGGTLTLRAADGAMQVTATRAGR